MKDKCKSYFGDYKCHVPTNVKDSKGRIVYVDKCLKEAIENLNAQGIKTVASCCGHGIIQPSIIIKTAITNQNKREIIKDFLKYEYSDGYDDAFLNDKIDDYLNSQNS